MPALIRFSVLLLTAARALAQIDVGMTMERHAFVVEESIPVVVTIKNTGGRDTVLGGPNGSSWINFLVYSEDGRPVTATGPIEAPAIVLRAERSLQRKFNVGRHYFVTHPGAYTVKAAVYFADLQRWITSRPLRFGIASGGKAKWAQTYALPPGHRQAGQYRRYQLFTFLDADKTYLYYRIVDESTRANLVTAALSSMVTGREIQPSVDAEQNLHVIYMGSPSIWVYQSVDPDGRILAQRYYRSAGAPPTLKRDRAGSVLVAGGMVYDPLEKPETSPFRNLSDRPAGMALQ